MKFTHTPPSRHAPPPASANTASNTRTSTTEMPATRTKEPTHGREGTAHLGRKLPTRVGRFSKRRLGPAVAVLIQPHVWEVGHRRDFVRRIFDAACKQAPLRIKPRVLDKSRSADMHPRRTGPLPCIRDVQVR